MRTKPSELSSAQFVASLPPSLSFASSAASTHFLSLFWELSSDALLALSENYQIVSANSSTERVFGRAKEHLIESSFLDLLWPEDRIIFVSRAAEFRAQWAKANDDWQPLTFRLIAVSGEEEPFPVEISLMMSSQAEMLVLVRDRAHMVSGEKMLAFLARMSGELGASLEIEKTLERIPSLVVPEVADWCLVYLLDDIEGIQLASGRHVKRDRETELLQWAYTHPLQPQNPSGPCQVIRTGQTEVMRMPWGESNAEVLQQDLFGPLPAGFGSASMCVPMRVRDEIIGAIWIGLESSRTFLAEDMILMEELSSRAGIAVENSKLYLRTRQAENHLRLITDTVPTPIYYLDREGRIRFANQSHAAWRGRFSAGDGRLIREVWSHDFFSAAEAYFARCLTGETVSFETVERHADGSEHHFQSTFIPDCADGDSVSGVVGITFDITERKSWERNLEAAKAFADEASRAKTHFLANMSHEIRTPLGAILGFVDLLLMQEQSEADRHDWAERIRSNGGHLLRLINDILDLSKVESGTFDVDMEESELNDVMEEVVSVMRTRAQQKPIELEFILQTPVPARLRTDKTRLHQILTNIIGNAIKFTEHGKVAVKLRYEMGQLIWDIEDSGPGLSSEEIARLFQPFSQGDTSHSRKFGGTGLGLDLSRRLAQLLGGEVQLVFSERGRGSVFRFSLAVPADEKGDFIDQLMSKKALMLAQDRSPEANLTGIRLLLVDDSPDNRVLIKRFMQMEGAEVDTANDGFEGVEKALQSPYDIVLMDIQMPGIDGYEATRRLRSQNFTRPIIALTAHAMLEEKDRCLEAGCNQYLSKPVTRSELAQTILVVLEKGGWR